MVYRIVADSVLVLHLAFVVFALFGGLLGARWRWVPLLHLPAMAWASFVELSGRICPLTYVENDFRRLAGQSGYPESFIEHYLLRVVYPDGLTREIQWLLAGIVVAVNLVVYGWLIRRRRAVA